MRDSWFEAAFQTLKLANFAMFINQGRYPTIPHRLLEVTLEPVDKDAIRTVDFEYMNRQLLWQGLIVRILFIIPTL